MSEAAERARELLDTIVAWELVADALLADNARLREALGKHGEHHSGCDIRRPTQIGEDYGKCSCGLDAALRGEGA